MAVTHHEPPGVCRLPGYSAPTRGASMTGSERANAPSYKGCFVTGLGQVLSPGSSNESGNADFYSASRLRGVLELPPWPGPSIHTEKPNKGTRLGR